MRTVFKYKRNRISKICSRIGIAAEKTIKGWVRRKKVAMIEEENPEWHDLGPAVMQEER